MKILLAGMNYMPNQFSRAIEQSGCQVVHTSGDPGAFPKWCEAVVVAKCQISHQKFYDVKDEYIKQGKPVFTGDNFSTIKERFLDFVEKRRAEMRPNTILRKAFDEAKVEIVAEAPPKIEPEIIEEKKSMKPEQLQHSYRPEVKAEIFKVVHESKIAGLSADETVDMLHAHNLTKANGGQFNTFDVYNFRSIVNKMGKKKLAKYKLVVPSKAVTPEPKPKAVARPVSNELLLFTRILDLGLEPIKTVEFQNWLREGKLNVEQATWMLDVIEAMKK